jgi:hypothetical protein
MLEKDSTGLLDKTSNSNDMICNDGVPLCDICSLFRP